jgi:hypothetical protein
MQEIKLFLFVLSIVYSLRYIFEFVIKLTQEDSQPIKLSKVEGILLYIASSYIITYFLI